MRGPTRRDLSTNAEPPSMNAEPPSMRGPTRRDLKYLLDGLQTDVEFLVGDSPYTRIKAHKLVLAMRNVFFEGMFYGGMPEEKDVILIPDLHPDGFRGLLSFLYILEVKFDDVKTAFLTKKAAQKYLEFNLVKLCIKFVRENINPVTLCLVLDYLTKNQEPMSEYNDVINTTLSRDAAEVLNSKTFIAASPSVVLEVLRREKNISEYQVLLGIHAWAVANCSAVTDMPSDELLKSSMKPFLSEIKLLSLTPAEFVNGPIAWKIFSVDDAFCILCNIIKRGSMPLPEFCKP